MFLSIGGFGYWNYTLQKSVVKSYYTNHASSFTSTSEDAYYDIPDLSISINVKAGEKVYVMFTCTASLTAVSAVTLMRFLVKIDTTQITDSIVVIGYSGTLAILYIEYLVSLQYLATSVTAGSHTVTIMTMRECNGFIENSNLLVQVY